MHRTSAFVAGLAVFVSIAAGCAGEDAAATSGATPGRNGRNGGDASPAVPVTVAQVVRKSMPVEISVIGAAEPFSSVAIRSQITGQMTAVNFAEGDDVKAGQVLFTLDRRPLEAALEQAKANLDRDLAQAANAEAQFKRYQELADRGIAPREQVDTARASLSALNATVSADRAALDNAQVQLQYATITATLAGRTGELQVHEGNLVRANDQTPLVVINQIAPISVAFSIPEARLPELKRYMARGPLRVTALPPKDDGPPAVGSIAFVDNQVDQTTGTIRLKGTFPNDDRRLWPGQFLNVVVTLTSDPEAIVVPTAAVQAGQQGPYVFVVKDDRTVDLRAVEVSRTRASETVIANGVKPGETVVTDGHLRLVPGSRISVKGAS
jgi:multidrug efflux system membrane fusion protein